MDENYHVFWGYEDEKLFDFAKRKLSLLAKEDRPFNFEMLTVDTHHPYGYQEEKWEKPFDKGISNSIYHTDRLLEDFMTWLEKQPFYKDTLIVIQGDHTSMAAQYIHSNFDQGFDRRIASFTVKRIRCIPKKESLRRWICFRRFFREWAMRFLKMDWL